MTLRIGSLCSGAGMLDLAVMNILDARVAWHAQYEPPNKNGKPDVHQWAAQILAHRFPEVPNHGDITAIDYQAVERVDIVTAGWPCQDMSLAGKRAGMREGTRSGIWPHVVRAIEALQPRLVLLENVRSLTSAWADSNVEPCPWCLGNPGDDGSPVQTLRALGCVLGDLSTLGLDAQWTTLPASDVGACHRRERTFVLAWPKGNAPSVALGTVPDAKGDGRDQRRTEPAGQLWGLDAAVSRSAAPTDTDGLFSGDDREFSSGRDAVQRRLWNDASGLGPAASNTSGIGEREPSDHAHPVAGSRETRPEPVDRSLPDREREREDGSVIRLLPTPRTTDTNGAGMHGDGGMDLRTAVKTLTSTGDRTPPQSDGGRP